tara:strand:+ start:433 stop:918 length:486 start_codon:yes stop_codon:yes gene_type:complete
MCDGKSQALANFFIEKGIKESILINNMKLQKLMFIGYGWALAINNESLITQNETFEAWQSGPVLPSVYHEVKHLQHEPVLKKNQCFSEVDDCIWIPSLKGDSVKTVDKVWDIYKDFSPAALANLVKRKDTPWRNCFFDPKKALQPDKVRLYYEHYIKELFD